jgi:hypothetical protein
MLHVWMQGILNKYLGCVIVCHRSPSRTGSIHRSAEPNVGGSSLDRSRLLRDLCLVNRFYKWGGEGRGKLPICTTGSFVCLLRKAIRICSDLLANHGIGQYSTHFGQYRRILVNKSPLTNKYLVSPMVGNI